MRRSLQAISVNQQMYKIFGKKFKMTQINVYIRDSAKLKQYKISTHIMTFLILNI